MLAPGTRRSLSYFSAGVLGCAALRELIQGTPANAHLLAIAASGSVLLPTLWKNSQWFGPVETSFKTDGKKIWITIDDGPDPAETPQILKVLEKHGVKATFFAIGDRIARWPDLARQIVRSGHGLENHTYHHHAASYWCAPPKTAEREILRCNDIIFETTGYRPTLFRAPVGLANPFVHSAAKRAGLTMIGWSSSGLDGIAHHPGTVISRILGKLSPGAIVLIHDGALKGMAPGIRGATLNELLTRIQALGYEAILPKYPQQPPLFCKEDFFPVTKDHT